MERINKILIIIKLVVTNKPAQILPKIVAILMARYFSVSLFVICKQAYLAC